MASIPNKHVTGGIALYEGDRNGIAFCRIQGGLQLRDIGFCGNSINHDGCRSEISAEKGQHFEKVRCAYGAVLIGIRVEGRNDLLGRACRGPKGKPEQKVAHVNLVEGKIGVFAPNEGTGLFKG